MAHCDAVWEGGNHPIYFGSNVIFGIPKRRFL